MSSDNKLLSGGNLQRVWALINELSSTSLNVVWCNTSELWGRMKWCLQKGHTVLDLHYISKYYIYIYVTSISISSSLSSNLYLTIGPTESGLCAFTNHVSPVLAQFLVYTWCSISILNTGMNESRGEINPKSGCPVFAGLSWVDLTSLKSFKKRQKGLCVKQIWQWVETWILWTKSSLDPTEWF